LHSIPRLHDETSKDESVSTCSTRPRQIEINSPPIAFALQLEAMWRLEYQDL
jgi:hypothetical protein